MILVRFHAKPLDVAMAKKVCEEIVKQDYQSAQDIHGGPPVSFRYRGCPEAFVVERFEFLHFLSKAEEYPESFFIREYSSGAVVVQRLVIIGDTYDYWSVEGGYTLGLRWGFGFPPNIAGFLRDSIGAHCLSGYNPHYTLGLYGEFFAHPAAGSALDQYLARARAIEAILGRAYDALEFVGVLLRAGPYGVYEDTVRSRWCREVYRALRDSNYHMTGVAAETLKRFRGSQMMRVSYEHFMDLLSDQPKDLLPVRRMTMNQFFTLIAWMRQELVIDERKLTSI